jgi:crotonobetainyl-CoA:carnitine CoA-transferase CaiB-like acyl-CoA transferase
LDAPAINRGSVTVNLATEDGRVVFGGLIREDDAFIENDQRGA